MGIAGEKAWHGGGARGMAEAAADRRLGCFRGGRGGEPPVAGGVGAAIWPVVAGGSGGWRLKMNRRPLISYPMDAKSTD